MDVKKEQQLTYLTRRRSEVPQLKMSLLEENFDLAMTIGHRLKGHGETFGFNAISSLGELMEKAAKDKNMPKLKQIVKDLDLKIEESLKLINCSE